VIEVFDDQPGGLDEFREAHDRHFKEFVRTGDLKQFEAARAIAIQIIQHEKSISAYSNSDLHEMYFSERRK
jgi:hypothetical protein